MSANGSEPLGEGVALTVMGWRRASRSWAYSQAADVWQDGDGVTLMPCAAWRPEDDDAQSMRVVERMCALGFDYALTGGPGGAEAAFHHDDGRAASASDPALRRAMLRAALAAVDGDG